MDLEKRMEELENDLQQHMGTIDFLEKRIRLHRWIGFAACCVVLILVVWTAWTSRESVKRKAVVEAEKFVLRDRSGKIRGVWRMTDDNLELGMEGKNGQKLRLGLNQENSGLVVSDSKGKGRFLSGTVISEPGKKEIPVVALFSGRKGGDVRLTAAGEKEKAYGLHVIDSSGKIRGIFGLLKDDVPVLSLNDSEERFRTMLIFTKEGKSILVHYDKNKRIIWSSPPPKKSKEK